MEGDESSSSFPIGETAQEWGLSHVTQCCVIPTSDRPSLNPETADVPVVDLMGFGDSSSRRSTIVKDIGNACRCYGFFQVSAR